MALAMRRSLSTIAASAVTTLFGFAALAFMQFQIGADLGINLVKGIVFSFFTVMVFLPAVTLSLYKLIDKTRHRLLMPSFKNVGKVLSKVRVPGSRPRVGARRSRVFGSEPHRVHLPEQRGPTRTCAPAPTRL